jgi:flagellar hook-associated protein 2
MGISLNPATILSGQGIDVNSLVQQIIGNQSGPITQWQAQEAALQDQAVALTAINNDLNNLATAITALSNPVGALFAEAANSSNTGVLTATATSAAAAGTHQITVTNLASLGSVYSNEVSSPTASILPTGATGGDIQLQVGTGASASTHDIQITAGSNDTLNTLASYINSHSYGVTANVVTDAGGSRLSLISQATGSPGALAINANNTNLVFNTPTGGINASLSIDGVPYSSTTNTITGAISGVTLNLTGTTSGTPVQLSVGPDTAQVTQAINNFISAYNTVIGDINTQYTVNAATNNEGPLGGDQALRSLQSSLLADASYALPGSTGGSTVNSGVVNLASLGISMNNDGTLSLNSAQDTTDPNLNNLLASNPAAVQNFFQNSSQTGFANNFNNDLTNLTDPVSGVLNVDIAQNKTETKNLTTSITNFQAQLTTEQQQLTQQYAKVNASLQEYPLLLQQVTETLGSLTSQSSTGTTNLIGNPTLTSGL